MNQKESLTKKGIRISLVAALYVALTLALSWISYGEIQFRIAEILVLLCFFRKDYAISMIIGCAIANTFSTLGPIDIVMGTIATSFAVICVMFSKNLLVAGIFPVIFNAIIVGIELSIVFKTPFWLNALTVGLGEFVVILIGIFTFHLLKKNVVFMKMIKANQNI